MATTNKIKLLSLPHLPAIHMKDPAVGKTFKQILDYINKNVTPKEGNKQ